MTINLLLVLLVLVILISHRNSKKIAWADRMIYYEDEWHAPKYVWQHVHSDYLSAQNWMRDSINLPVEQQRTMASVYLTDDMLHERLRHLDYLETADAFCLVERDEAQHYIDVQQFVKTGEACYVVDLQRNRSVTVLDFCSGREYHVQCLEDDVFVFEMRFDKQQYRWKLARFVQELPIPIVLGNPSASYKLALIR